MTADKNKISVSKVLNTKAQLKLYKSIVEALPQGVFIKDVTGHYILVNDYINQILMPPGQDAVGHTDADIFGAEEGRKITGKDDKVWGQEGTIAFVEKVPLADGMHWFKTYKKIIPSPVDSREKLLIGFPTDITKLKDTQAELEKRDNHLENLYNTTPNAIVVYDLEQGKMIDYNQVFTRQFGTYDEPEQQFNLLDLIHPKEKADLLRTYQILQDTKKENTLTKVYRLRAKNKRYYWFRVFISYHCSPTSAECFIFIAQNVDQIERLQRKYKHLAEQDELTKLYNRRYFIKALRARIKRKTPYTLLFADLNDFKSINDRYGHDYGDELLRLVGFRLKSIFRRRSDVVARFGGDEFVVLIDGLLTATINQELPQRIRSQFTEPFVLGSHTVSSHPSIGAVTVANSGQNYKTIMKIADEAMYRAKTKQNLEFVWCSDVCPTDYRIF